MHAYRLFAPLLLLLALSGCSMTVFEALPPGTATQCAPTWPGHWVKVKSPSNQTTAEAEDEIEVEEIDANCSDVNKAGSGKPAPVTLISTPDGRQYIEFMATLENPAASPARVTRSGNVAATCCCAMKTTAMRFVCLTSIMTRWHR